MLEGQTRLLMLAVAAVIVLGSGVWLTVGGSPYGMALQTVHKLSALVAVVLFAIRLYPALRVVDWSVRDVALIAAVALGIVASFATGGVVSAMKSAPTWALMLHRIGTWLAWAGLSALVYFWGGQG